MCSAENSSWNTFSFLSLASNMILLDFLDYLLLAVWILFSWVGGWLGSHLAVFRAHSWLSAQEWTLVVLRGPYVALGIWIGFLGCKVLPLWPLLWFFLKVTSDKNAPPEILLIREDFHFCFLPLLLPLVILLNVLDNATKAFSYYIYYIYMYVYTYNIYI